MTNNNTAAEAADVLLAADGLPTESLLMMMSVFARMANKCDGYSAAERELFHSVARLLARVRDIHAERWQALKRADRQTQLRQNSTTNADLRAEFDSLVIN
jgi:fructoselysine-6-P-deglycase FrlB-like protein